MKLYCIINDNKYDIVEGATFSEEYNETLDSGSIVIDQVQRINNLEPFDDVYIYDYETNGKVFYKHMLVDTFNEELNNLNNVLLYKYKISLFSETKRLEKTILPNISITQPLKKVLRRSIWEYLNAYLDIFSPKIKVAKGNNSWEYEKKYNFTSSIHELPNEYIEAEYLESTGEQSIDTGIIFNPRTDSVEIDVQSTDANQNGMVFGNWGYSGHVNYFALYYYHNGSRISFYGTYGNVGTQTELKTNLNNANLNENVILYKDNSSYVDNNYVDTTSATFDIPIDTAFLFGAHYSTATAGWKFKGKVYNCKIWRSGNLIRNFVPCVRKLDNKPGMYDIVNSVFYTNRETSSSSDFLYKKVHFLESENGKIINSLYKRVKYIEGTGTQFIDTGVVQGTSKNVLEATISFNRTDLTNQIIGFNGHSGSGIGTNLYNWWEASDLGTINATEKYNIKWIKEGTNWEREVNGSVVSGTDGNTSRPNDTLFLFAARKPENNYEPGYFCSCKIYDCKIYQNDILIRDLVPCIRLEDNKPGLYDLINNVFYDNDGTGEFNYQILTETSIKEIFQKLDAPEISLTNPTLRDLISQLLLTKDLIPIVRDNVIGYMDVSKRNGAFSTDPNYVSFIHSSMNSDDFATDARREYGNALSQQNTCKMVEYLGFRDSSNVNLKLANLVLETRYPIYKINKIYMCYYKKVEVYDVNRTSNNYNIFMCKQNITDLVVQNVVRQALSQDYSALYTGLNNGTINTTTKLSKYKPGTVSYDIGSNQITGWGEKYSYLTDGLAWFKKEYSTLQNIIGFMDNFFPFGEKGYRAVLENKDQAITPGYSKGSMNSIFTNDVYDNETVNQKAVFFQIEYDAMFNGALVHSKDFKEKDDLLTADNCSTSLSILEIDGLFEKEKLNRLGNRQYNIQSRYEGNNAYLIMNGSNCNHILGSFYDNDVVIYHKEYQIYNNIILANFAGTYDYVLKNYFISVFAKLRTYSLATYNESVVRAENYKEYIVLDENNATYESGTLIYNYLDKYISCFNTTPIDKELYMYIEKNKINYAYIQSKTYGDASSQLSSTAFCDVNTFCSGYSMCVNLKMYDNVTHGVYIKEANKALDETETGTAIGSIQEWALAVNDKEDAFQEKMIFGFGHLYHDGDTISDQNKSVAFFEQGRYFEVSETRTIGGSIIPSDITRLYENKLLHLPSFYTNNYYNTNSEYSIFNKEGGLTIYKDNKETIDYTFQFETITNSNNVYFSSWFVKLNDMSGAYLKWTESEDLSSYGGYSGHIFNCDIWYTRDNQDIYFYLKIAKEKLANVPSPYIIDNLEETRSPQICYYYTVIFVPYYAHTQYYEYQLSQITKDNNNNLYAFFIYSIRELWRRLLTYDTHNSQKSESFLLEKYNEDSIYNYYKCKILTVGAVANIKESVNADRFNQHFTTKVSGQTLSRDELIEVAIKRTKNMFVFLSEKPIEKEIIYDNYLTSFYYNDTIKADMQYSLKEAYNRGGVNEDKFIYVGFVDENNVHYKGITFDLVSTWYIKDNGDQIIVYENSLPLEQRWRNSAYSKITFDGNGQDFNTFFFKEWVSLSIGKRAQTTFSGIIFQNLPSYMHMVNTDDKYGYLNNQKYISFSDLFDFEPKSEIYGLKKFDSNITGFPEEGEDNITFNVNFSFMPNGINTYNCDKIILKNDGLYYQYNNGTDEIFVYSIVTGWLGDNYNSVVINSSQELSDDFKNWFYNNSNWASIPRIRIGNELLKYYKPHKSIQFWYLDNNSTSGKNEAHGAGKLHFVFGVNTEENETDVFVSTETKRSPYVFASDHKTILGEIKRMNANNFIENNEYEIENGHSQFLSTPVINENKTFSYSFVCDGEVYYGIKIYNQKLIYIRYDETELEVFSSNTWNDNKYKNIIMLNDIFVGDEDFTTWLKSSSIQQFTVENKYNGDNTISFVYDDETLFNAPKLEYSKNRVTWYPYTLSTNVILQQNEKVYFRGDNDIFNNDFSTFYTHLTSTQNIDLSGNIMSLRNKNSENSPRFGSYYFKKLFAQNTHIINAHNLILPHFVDDYCYDNMFSGCTSLVTAPSLPATTLASGCYEGMFYDCTSLYVSDTQTTEATRTWTIPTTGTFTNETTYNQTNMFKNCRGTRSSDDMSGALGESHTYYTQNEPV